MLVVGQIAPVHGAACEEDAWALLLARKRGRVDVLDQSHDVFVRSFAFFYRTLEAMWLHFVDITEFVLFKFKIYKVCSERTVNLKQSGDVLPSLLRIV